MMEMMYLSLPCKEYSTRFLLVAIDELRSVQSGENDFAN
jgi:hypothetical protein